MFLKDAYKYGKIVAKEKGVVVGVLSATFGALAMGAEKGLGKFYRKSKPKLRVIPDDPEEA